MARFVVLEHRWGGVHWDVMLERGEALRTWAVDAPIVAGVEMSARALADHRIAYLDYEGPVSGGRGAVRRIATGTYETIEWTDDRVVVILSGDQLSGEVIFSREAGGGWSFDLLGKVD